MHTKRDQLMQEVETYGNGLLSDETIEYTVDIIMECDPVPDSIDLIAVSSATNTSSAGSSRGGPP